jgi:hypothetical protein
VTDDEIEKALVLANAATPGPWRRQTEGEAVECGYHRHSRAIVDRAGQPVVIEDPSEGEYAAAVNSDHDAAFIAAARTGWPAALLALREARRRIAELESHVPGWKADIDRFEDERDEAREIGSRFERLLAREEELRGKAEAEVARLREALEAVYRWSNDTFTKCCADYSGYVPREVMEAVTRALSPHEPDKETGATKVPA